MPSYSIIILWFNPLAITSQPSQHGPELWVGCPKKTCRHGKMQSGCDKGPGRFVEMMADYELKLLGNLFFVPAPVTVLKILGFF